MLLLHDFTEGFCYPFIFCILGTNRQTNQVGEAHLPWAAPLLPSVGRSYPILKEKF